MTDNPERAVQFRVPWSDDPRPATPHRTLIGWASARALQSLADHNGKSRAWSIRLRYDQHPNSPFPIYVGDPTDD